MQNDEYKKLLSDSRDFYKGLGSCHCPVLNSRVTFNSKGFHHLLYDGEGKARSKNERIRRLVLLPAAKSIVEGAACIDNHTMRGDAEYLVLKGLSRQRVIIVVLRRLYSGRVHFYSIWDDTDIRGIKKPPK